jgi:hypothetical protein
MTKKDCLKWAQALINGEFKKLTGKMSNSRNINEKPMACCCLGVANEVLAGGDFSDRVRGTAEWLSINGVFKSGANPVIFGVVASRLNDGYNFSSIMGIDRRGLTHEEIGILLLLAIETGEYKNI